MLRPQRLDYVLGITKAYSTRVGSGPFPTELRDATGEHLRTRGHEFGSVTGRPRRCGWFDAAALRRAVQLNGTTGLCITKLDVLDGLPSVKLVHRLPLSTADDVDILPYGADAVARCEPVYEEFAGMVGIDIRHSRLGTRCRRLRGAISSGWRKCRGADRYRVDRAGPRTRRSCCATRSS